MEKENLSRQKVLERRLEIGHIILFEDYEDCEGKELMDEYMRLRKNNMVNPYITRTFRSIKNNPLNCGFICFYG